MAFFLFQEATVAQYDTTFHYTGAIRTLGLKKDGLPHYFWNQYNLEGELVESKLYNYGRVIRKISYYPSGQKKLQINYRDNESLEISTEIKEGKLIGWSKTGLIIHESNYTSNVLDGSIKEWHENGMKKTEGTYKKGKRVGPWKEWHPNSNLKLAGVYDTKGEKEGLWYYFTEEEEILLKVDFNMATREKIIQFTYYYSNGKGKKQGYYRYDKTIYENMGTIEFIVWREKPYRPDGKWTYWHLDGSLEKEVIFDFGRIIDQTDY